MGVIQMDPDAVWLNLMQFPRSHIIPVMNYAKVILNRIVPLLFAYWEVGLLVVVMHDLSLTRLHELYWPFNWLHFILV